MTKKLVQKKGRHFTRDEKHQIIQEMIANGCTKREILEKYTGQAEEHGQLLRWMKKLGYPTKEKPLSVTFERKSIPMPRKRKSKQESIDAQESFENLQLKKRIKELERQLKDAELKAIAFSTMVDFTLGQSSLGKKAKAQDKNYQFFSLVKKVSKFNQRFYSYWY